MSKGLIGKDKIWNKGDIESGATWVISEFERIANGAKTHFGEIKKSYGDVGLASQKTAKLNKDYTDSLKKTNILIEDVTKAITKNTTAVNANTKAKKKYVGNAAGAQKANKGLLSSFKRITLSLRNLAIAYFGFQTLIKGFQDIFKVTKILDSIDFSQTKVIKSSVELAQTQQWLSKIISDYGLDLVTVTNRYTKFRAATNSSNLSAEQTQKIFGSMSKAAATLGLKTDELQGVYLALEQMISKNKVTTEELRRQLGERLPGAFDIMAKSMGVSTNELNKMLRAGVVMSEEVLPKFAEEVEKAYGIENVKKVNTLVAAQNRLRTEWIKLIKDMSATEFFKGLLNIGSKALSGLSVLFKDELGESIRKEQKSVRALASELTDANTTEEERADILLKLKVINEDVVDGIDSENISLDRLKKNLDEYNKSVVNRIILETLSAEESKKSSRLADVQIEKGESIAAINTLIAETDQDIAISKATLNEKTEALIASLIKQGASMDDVLKKSDIEIDAHGRIADLRSKEQKTLDELIVRRSRLNIVSAEEAELLKDLENLLKRQDAILKALGITREKLKGKDNAKTVKDALKNQRLANKQEVDALKSDLEIKKSLEVKSMLEQGKTKSQIAQQIQDIDSENKLKLLKLERQLNEKLINISGNTATDIAKIKADDAKLTAKIAKEKTDNEITQIERSIDEAERLRDQQIVDDIVREEEQFKFAADKLIAQLKNREITAGEFQLKYAKIEEETQRKILQIQLDAEKKKLSLLDFGTIEYEQSRNKIIALEKAINEEITQENKSFADSWIENRQAVRDKSIELINEVFNAQMAAYDAQLQRAQEVRDFQVALAGSNTEERIKAERKYEKEELKIRQRQARAQKAQSAFNIITSTAAAIAKTLEITGFFGIPLTVLVAAIGAVQLATVLAQPVPKFAEGGIADGLAIVGDKKGDSSLSKAGGSELITTPDGKSFLSPMFPTLMDLPSGTIVTPHNETQQILAQGAMRSASERISLSSTDGILKQIRDKNDITYSDGYKRVIKKGFKGKYRCS